MPEKSVLYTRDISFVVVQHLRLSFCCKRIRSMGNTYVLCTHVNGSTDAVWQSICGWIMAQYHVFVALFLMVYVTSY